MENKIRVILDTNLWISYLISKRLKRIDQLFEEDKIILVFSQELIEEFVEVAQRPKFSKYFSQEDIEALLSQFNVYGELIEVTSQVEECRDRKDNFLLALAKDGHSDFLITGDKDLLEIREFEGTQILEYWDFEQQLN